ncbi:MAG: four helix bundle protein, partial [Segetibacter sp.]
FQFAKRVRAFTRMIKRDVENIEDIKQLVRASGSVGANYIEANESLGRADLRMRIKISRKEAKEAIYFLGLLQTSEVPELDNEREFLVNEAIQLKKIFSKMLKNLGE